MGRGPLGLGLAWALQEGDSHAALSPAAGPWEPAVPEHGRVTCACARACVRVRTERPRERRADVDM